MFTVQVIQNAKAEFKLGRLANSLLGTITHIGFTDDSNKQDIIFTTNFPEKELAQEFVDKVKKLKGVKRVQILK